MADVTMKTDSASNPDQSGNAAASAAPQSAQSTPLEVSTLEEHCQALTCLSSSLLHSLYADTQAGKAEKIALNTHAALNTAAMPVRQYLEATVEPILMQGLGQVVRERPSDPVEYLAAYLLKHNPQQQQQPAAQASKPT